MTERVERYLKGHVCVCVFVREREKGRRGGGENRNEKDIKRKRFPSFRGVKKVVRDLYNTDRWKGRERARAIK